MEKQLKALASELRKLGVRGKVDGSTYVAPKTVEADDLERKLQRAGWTCIKSGMYYTEHTPWDLISNHAGVFQKDGLEAHVKWGRTDSTNPPSIRLHDTRVM